MKKIILIAILLLVYSCDENNNITESSSSRIITYGNEIMPLAVGNVWEYKEYEYQNSKLLAERIMKIEVLDKIFVDVDGEKIEVYKLKESRILNGDDENGVYFILRNENDTIYWLGHSLENNDEYYINKTIYVKYPIEVGENWIQNHGDYNDYFTCESVNDTVRLNGNIYECVRIRLGSENWYEDKYFSAGIGLVYEESTSGWEVNCNLRKRILVNNILNL